MTAATARSAGIRFGGVSFAYSGGGPVLRDVDWEIEQGAFVLVSGESGSGKSTLLRCLNGLVPHFSGGRFGGRVVVDGHDTRRHGPRALSSTVGFVFQEPDAQRVAAVVEDELAFGMEQLGVPRQTMRKRVEEVLDLLGIASLRHRDLDTLSGGERQRVAVAAALTLQPRVLVLDEPTSQLDPWGAEDVLTALERLNHDLGLTVILAEHRLERVLPIVDRMRALFPGGGVIDATPREVIRELDDAMLPPVPRLGRALEWVPLPLTVKEGRQSMVRSGHRPPPLHPWAGGARGTPVVTVEGLSSTYGRRPVLRDVALEVRPGEILGLMGRNGSGKTTLLRSIMGFHRPERGRIVVDGIDVGRSDPVDVARSAAYLPQRPGSILFNETLRAELAFTVKHHPERGHKPDELLRDLELFDLAERDPRDLSAGERERAALAAVLVANPAILLLDEPTRGMDYRRKRALAALLRRRSEHGMATIMATHDVELVAEVASRVVLLGEGEVVADGSPRQVLSGSLTYATQINKLYGGEYLTVEDVLGNSRAAGRGG